MRRYLYLKYHYNFLNHINTKLCQDLKREREDIPENNIASLQEELAASKLREAESNLALKDLRSKVSDLNTMWQKHLKVKLTKCLIQTSEGRRRFP